MTDVSHTIVSVLLLFVFHVWGYHRAMQRERVEGMKEVLSYLKEIGVINDFNFNYEDQEDDEQ